MRRALLDALGWLLVLGALCAGFVVMVRGIS